MAARNLRIGPAVVREWSRSLPRGACILDLGCGHGVPVSQALIAEGFDLHGVDASAKLIAEFRKRFPTAHAECAAVEDSEFFARTFEGVIAWGLMFMLSIETQRLVIRKVAGALKPGGKFLFTSPKDAVTWNDSLTGQQSRSPGAEWYRQTLRAEGLVPIGEKLDEGENYYYFASKTLKPARQRTSPCLHKS